MEPQRWKPLQIQTTPNKANPRLTQLYLVQVKEFANLFYFSVYSVFLKYCILNDILMLQRVLSYILRYMHIGNLLKKTELIQHTYL